MDSISTLQPTIAIGLVMSSALFRALVWLMDCMRIRQTVASSYNVRKEKPTSKVAQLDYILTLKPIIVTGLVT